MFIPDVKDGIATRCKIEVEDRFERRKELTDMLIYRLIKGPSHRFSEMGPSESYRIEHPFLVFRCVIAWHIDEEKMIQ